MKADIESVIKDIKKLDLSKYPHQEIKTLISSIGKIGIIESVFENDKSFIRGRINCDNKSFENISDLSYKPSHLNTQYYRASTPNKTMFYGAIIPNYINDNEINQAYVTVSFEISEFLKDISKSGQIKLTFGRWNVVKPIKVVSILFYEDYIRKSNLSAEVNKGFSDYIAKYPHLRENIITWNRFIGEEFAKNEIKEDWNYLISAIFSEIVVENGFDGILYPSVPLQGKGFNIALTPECVDSKLTPTLVAESNIYKLNGKMILDWELICHLKKNQKEIVYEKDRLNLGTENCWKKLQE